MRTRARTRRLGARLLGWPAGAAPAHGAGAAPAAWCSLCGVSGGGCADMRGYWAVTGGKGRQGSSSLSIEVGIDLWQLRSAKAGPPAGRAAFHHLQRMGRDFIFSCLKRTIKAP